MQIISKQIPNLKPGLYIVVILLILWPGVPVKSATLPILERAALESQVCPSSGEDEEPLCFIRNLAQEKEWAMVILARERMNDSYLLFQWDKLKNTWSQKVSFSTLDYENLKEEHVEISKNTYAILLKKLKLFEDKI